MKYYIKKSTAIAPSYTWNIIAEHPDGLKEIVLQDSNYSSLRRWFKHSNGHIDPIADNWEANATREPTFCSGGIYWKETFGDSL